MECTRGGSSDDATDSILLESLASLVIGSGLGLGSGSELGLELGLGSVGSG